MGCSWPRPTLPLEPRRKVGLELASLGSSEAGTLGLWPWENLAQEVQRAQHEPCEIGRSPACLLLHAGVCWPDMGRAGVRGRGQMQKAEEERLGDISQSKTEPVPARPSWVLLCWSLSTVSFPAHLMLERGRKALPEGDPRPQSVKMEAAHRRGLFTSILDRNHLALAELP